MDSGKAAVGLLSENVSISGMCAPAITNDLPLKARQQRNSKPEKDNNRFPNRLGRTHIRSSGILGPVTGVAERRSFFLVIP